MHNLLTALLSFVCLLSLGACDQRRNPSAAKSPSMENPIVQETSQFESEVRLAAANKRIDELELKVHALEATPEKLDLDLLTQRVTALEVKSSGAAAAVSNMVPGNNAMQALRPPSGAARVARGARQAPAGSSKLNLPDLENRPRSGTSLGATSTSSK
jgi:hypothetical protein